MRRRNDFNKIIVINLFFISCSFCIFAAEIPKTSLKIVEERTNSGDRQRTIIMDNGIIQLPIRYILSTLPDGTIAADPYISAINLGIDGPRMYFNLRSNHGLNLARKPFSVQLFQAEQDRKGVRILWKLPEGEVTLTLSLRSGDDCVYGRFAIRAEGELTLTEILYPGGYTPHTRSYDRHILTANGEYVPGDKIPYLGSSDWLLLYDTKLDPAQRRGSGALGIAWRTSDKIKPIFKCGEYSSTLIVPLKNTRFFDFAIRPYLMIGNNEAISLQQKNAPKYFRELIHAEKRFKFRQHVEIIRPNNSCVKIYTKQAGEIYGIDNIVLENKYLRIEVSPHRGGRIISLIFKETGKEFIFWNKKTGTGGALALMSATSSYPGIISQKAHAYTRVEYSPERGIIRFTGRGEGESSGLVFERDLILTHDARYLEVKLRIYNRGFTKRIFALRIHNYLLSGGRMDGANVWINTSRGVSHISKKKIFDWLDGWMACTDSKGGAGIAGIFDYNQVDSAMFWTMQKNASMEIFYSPITFKPGEIWETKLAYVPFMGLPGVIYASRKAVVYATNETASIYGVSDGILNLSSGSSAGSLAKIPFHPGQLQKLSLVKSVNGLRGIFEHTALSFSLTFDKTKPIAVQKKIPPPLFQKSQKKITITMSENHDLSKRKRILVLSFWDYGNVSWADEKEFPEIVKYTKPFKDPSYNFKRYFGQIIYCHRAGFFARESFQYYLRNNAAYQVDVAYESNFLSYLKKLWEYDILVINDFPAGALTPYIQNLREYVKAGHGLIFLGGYQSYGGRGRDFGNWRKLSELLPVKIVSSPDFVNQTSYMEKELRRRGAYCGRCMMSADRYGGPQPYIRVGPWVTITNPWHRSGWNWMASGKRVQVARILHPIIAGLPWNELSPNYHRVQVKNGSQVLLSVAGNPVLVTQKFGNGRIIASMFTDERRFYFWKYSSRFYRQMADWCTGQTQPVLDLAVAKNKAMLRIYYPISDITKKNVRIMLQGEDFSQKVLLAESVIIKPKKTASVTIKLPNNLLSMRYTLIATMEDITAVASFGDNTKKVNPLFLNFKNRHVFLQDEPVPFSLSIQDCEHVNHIELTVRDENGHLMLRQTLWNFGAIRVSTAGWALGEYAIRIDALCDRRYFTQVEHFYITHRRNFYVPVTWSIKPPIYFSENDSAASLAWLRYGKLQCASNYGVFTSSYGHKYVTADQMLQEGVYGAVRSGQASYSYPLDPSIIYWLQTKFDGSIGYYAKYPSVRGVFIDDEGTSCHNYWAFWKRRAVAYADLLFKHRYHRPLRQLPRTKQEEFQLAEFYDMSYNWLAEQHLNAARSQNPAWNIDYVLSFCHQGIFGTYVPRQFKYSEFIFDDVYPITENDIGEDFLTFDIMRTVSTRLNKPAKVWVSEYRNRPNTMRMQAWLALLSGMKGLCWYSSGAGERTGVYRQDAMQTIPELNRMYLRLGPLIKIWHVPASHIALLYPRESMGQFKAPDAGEPMPWENGGKLDCYQDANYKRQHYRYLQDIAYRLHQHDIYFDILSSDDIYGSRVWDPAQNNWHATSKGGLQECYKAVIVTYADTLLPKTKHAMDVYANHGILVHAKSMRYDTTTIFTRSIPFETNETIAKLVQAQVPRVITPNKNVYANLLITEQGAKFVVVYNHYRKSVNCELIINQAAHIRAVSDLLTGEEFETIHRGNTIQMHIPCGAYSGRALRLSSVKTYRLALKIPNKIILNGQVIIKAIITSSAAEPVVFNLNIYSPDGKKHPLSDQYLLTSRKMAIPLNFGANVNTGGWRFELVNTHTGRRIKKTINLQTEK